MLGSRPSDRIADAVEARSSPGTRVRQPKNTPGAVMTAARVWNT